MHATMAHRQHTQAPKDLYNAIVSNNHLLVQAYIDNGGDPNVDLASLLPTRNEVVPSIVQAATHVTALTSLGLKGIASPLHLAVCNYFTNGWKDIYSPTAMSIMNTLIAAGADTSITVTNIKLSGVLSYWITHTVADAVTPYTLARTLKQYVGRESICGKEMDKVMKVLQAESQKDTLGYKNTPASVPVPKSVTNTWKALLFSKKFSDVMFKCQDGTVFHAHKCVLAAASPYFSAAFEGPWGEQHADGLWETSNSAGVMEAILSFMYIGTVAPDLMEQQPVDMLALASEYSLPCLRELCEASCARSLSVNNVKIVLQLAHLHSSLPLKRSCFDFVKKNMAKVLTNPSVLSLAVEDAELWAELATAISPDGGNENQFKLASNKRDRSSGTTPSAQFC
jgi:hypothetical protein